MKKLLCAIVMAALGFSAAMADPIDFERAKSLAAKYVEGGAEPVLLNGGRSVNAKRRAAARKSTNIKPYYIFSRGENKGFVIVAADDILPEIIGYTETGNFNPDNIPPSMSDYLYGYEVALDKYNEYVSSEGIAGLQKLAAKRAQPRRASTATTNLGPLMTSSWVQGWPYNDYCPLYDGTNRAVTGCVATSTSSVIHYWRNDNPRYLLTGTHRYTSWTYKVAVPTRDYAKGYPMKWELMQNSYGSVNYGSWNDHYTSVSDLLCIVGDLVDMDYGPSSGAQSSAQPTALGAFNLAGNNVWYSSVNNMDQWEEMIISDLEKGRPILYSGYSVDNNNNWSGHAFVLDGYRLSDGKYHFDFGWGDGYKGFFALSDVRGFNTDQSMTYQVYPRHLNIEADITAPTFKANTDNTVTVSVRNNGTVDYKEAVNLFCSSSPNPPTAWGEQQADWTTIPAGGQTVDLTFTVNPGSGNSWYLIAVDKDFHVLGRVKVPYTATEQDVTSTYIKNPSFETYDSQGRPTSWTYAEGQYSRDGDFWTYRAVGHDGARVLDSWVAGDKGNAISQKLTGLAAGTYRLEAKVATDPGNTVTVYAGDQSVTTGAHECGKYYLQQVVIDNIVVGANSSLTIGVKAGSWYKADDFRLIKYLVEPEVKNTNAKPYAGEQYFDITEAMAPWLSTESFGIYTNEGFAAGPDWGNYTGADGAVVAKTFFEKWVSPGSYLPNASLSQTIADLPNGTYYIGGSFIATSQGVSGADVEGVTLWAGDKRIEIATGDGLPEIFALEVDVTDGTLTYGIDVDCTTANWVAIDNLFLYWKGSETSYYAQATSTRPVRVPIVKNSRMENDLADWTINGNMKKQTTTYANFDPAFMECWVGKNDNLTNRSVTQDVYLYAGTYAFKAAVEAVQQGNTSLTVSGVNLKLGDTAVACHTGDHAPEYFTTPKVTVSKAGFQTVGLYLENATANWVAWDNAFLLCYGATVEDETEYERALRLCQEAYAANETNGKGAAAAVLAEYTWDAATLATKSEAEIAEAIKMLNTGMTIALNNENATSFITNYNFSGNSTDGWTMVKNVSGWEDIWARENVFNAWSGTINEISLFQDISGLPNGTYKLEAKVGTGTNNGYESRVALFIAPDGQEVGRSEEAKVLNSKDDRSFETLSCYGIFKGGKMRIGIRSDRSFYQIKDITLTYVTDDAEAERETANSILRQWYYWSGKDVDEYDATNPIIAKAEGVVVFPSPERPNQLIRAASAGQFANTNNKIVDGTCQNLVVTDGYQMVNSTSFTAKNATYTRNMTSKWGTLLLPYSIESGATVQYYILKSVDETTMQFTPVSSVPANTAAIYKRLDESGNAVTIGCTNVTVGKTADATTADDCSGWSLVGVYAHSDITDANAYYIASDKFWKTSGSISVNPFRAYFVNSSASAPKRLNISIDDTPTGIDAIENGELEIEQSGAVYDLQGRRVSDNYQSSVRNSQLPKGMYIVGGKKVLMK